MGKKPMNNSYLLWIPGGLVSIIIGIIIFSVWKDKPGDFYIKLLMGVMVIGGGVLIYEALKEIDRNGLYYIINLSGRTIKRKINFIGLSLGAFITFSVGLLISIPSFCYGCYSILINPNKDSEAIYWLLGGLLGSIFFIAMCIYYHKSIYKNSYICGKCSNTITSLAPSCAQCQSKFDNTDYREMLETDYKLPIKTKAAFKKDEIEKALSDIKKKE